MDTVSQYRDIVERVLDAYTRIPYSHGDLRCEAISTGNATAMPSSPSAGTTTNACITR